MGGADGYLPNRVINSARKLAALCRRLSRAVVTGPGNADIWNMEPAFDLWSRKLMQLIIDADTPVCTRRSRNGELPRATSRAPAATGSTLPTWWPR